MRAAGPESVFLAYVSLIFRVVQLGALYTQSEKTAKCAYIASTLCICILFVAIIAKDEAASDGCTRRTTAAAGDRLVR